MWFYHEPGAAIRVHECINSLHVLNFLPPSKLLSRFHTHSPEIFYSSLVTGLGFKLQFIALQIETCKSKNNNTWDNIWAPNISIRRSLVLNWLQGFLSSPLYCGILDSKIKTNLLPLNSFRMCVGCVLMHMDRKSTYLENAEQTRRGSSSLLGFIWTATEHVSASHHLAGDWTPWLGPGFHTH